jgi:hypothetical protein
METINPKMMKGICIDTALLMTSLLIAGGVPSKCAIGEVVRTQDGIIAGYHAWSTFIFKGVDSVCETTIHFNAETINSKDSVYNKCSDWARNNGIYYREQANFDNVDYIKSGDLGQEMVQLMGLPSIRVECYGLQDTLERMEKKKASMVKEWRQEEAFKHKILSQAYRGL